MRRKRTPTIKEIVTHPKRRGKKYTVYLTIDIVNYIDKHGGVKNRSRVIDRILKNYVEDLKSKRKRD